jgi:hypothetical protein
MTHGSGVFTPPLPIENPLEPPEGDSQLMLVTNYPIYGFYYACKNIVVASCGCIYHLFCMCRNPSHNPSFGLATKAKGVARLRAKRKPGS